MDQNCSQLPNLKLKDILPVPVPVLKMTIDGPELFTASKSEIEGYFTVLKMTTDRPKLFTTSKSEIEGYYTGTGTQNDYRWTRTVHSFQI
jgi:hypothetical protein